MDSWSSYRAWRSTLPEDVRSNYPALDGKEVFSRKWLEAEMEARVGLERRSGVAALTGEHRRIITLFNRMKRCEEEKDLCLEELKRILHHFQTEASALRVLIDKCNQALQDLRLLSTSQRRNISDGLQPGEYRRLVRLGDMNEAYPTRKQTRQWEDQIGWCVTIGHAFAR